MAIRTFNPTANEMQLCCIACATDTPFVQLPDEIRSIDFCPCNYVCDYEEPVFGFLEDITDTYKNDKSSFIGKKTDSTSLFEATIKNLTTGEDYLVTDNTYGVYYPAGTLPEKPLYIAFIADWGKILENLGGGLYQIEFKENVFGVDYIQDTVKYRLEHFSDIRANNTVKFQFIQNGIKENGLDYTGLNFSYEFRLKGTFGGKQVILEVDNYLTSSRTVRQIQDKIRYSYEFTSSLIDATVLNSIWEIGLNANEILVTDYNVLNSERFENVSVVSLENPDINHYKNNPLVSVTIPFEDRKQTNVKRNV